MMLYGTLDAHCHTPCMEFILHYLDDFLVVTAAEECRGDHALCILLETFEQLGLPVAWDKLESPTSCLTFLGFELDSLRNEIRIPRQKMHDIKERWQDG